MIRLVIGPIFSSWPKIAFQRLVRECIIQAVVNSSRPATEVPLRDAKRMSRNDRIGNDLQTVRDTQWIAVAIMSLVCATAVVSISFFADVPVAWHVWAAYLLVIPAMGLLMLSILFVAKGADRISRTPFWLGFGFIVGGITFDLWATLLQSPDLSMEGNKVISTLLYSDHNPDFIYVYGLGLQSILACIMILLWAGFLRHRHTWFNAVMSQTPRTFAEFLKAATGGGRLTWRQYFAPKGKSELLCVYHTLLWTLPPMLLYAAAFRWYVALDWFEIVPGPYSLPGVRMVASMAACIFGAFFLWLYLEFYIRSSQLRKTVKSV